MICKQGPTNMCHYIGAEMHVIVLPRITQQIHLGVADNQDIYFHASSFTRQGLHIGVIPKLSADIKTYIPQPTISFVRLSCYASIWHITNTCEECLRQTLPAFCTSFVRVCIFICLRLKENKGVQRAEPVCPPPCKVLKHSHFHLRKRNKKLQTC